MNALREQLTCATCGTGFERLGARGPKPSRCTACRVPPPPPRACAQCGSTFQGRRGPYCTPGCRNRANYQRARADGRYDEWLRAQKDKYEPVRPTCTCVVCGSEFTARIASAKYCQPLCSRRAYAAARHADGRIAEQRRKRATQRAAYQAAYRVTLPCAACGTPTTQAKGRTERPTCGNVCRAYFAAGEKWPVSEVSWSHPIRSTPVPKDHKCRRRLRGPRFVSGNCRHCQAPITIDRLQPNAQIHVYCTELCRARERSRMIKIRGVAIDRYAVFRRDGSRCYLCNQMVRHDVTVPHPRAATVDHVIPLARGGPHEMSNLRTACFMCNCRKGDRGGGEQLALLG